MISSWPEYREDWHNPYAEDMAERMKSAVRAIRNLRTEMNVANSRKAKVYIVADDEKTGELLEECRESYEHMIFASQLLIQMDKTGIEENAVSVVIPRATIYMPLTDLVDFEKEKERLTKEKKRLEGELRRVNGMLNNEKFMSKAPEEKIAQERQKLEKYTGMMEKVEKELAALNR